MKMAGFLGSPRKNGNTAILLHKVMEGAEKEGDAGEVKSNNALMEKAYELGQKLSLTK